MSPINPDPFGSHRGPQSTTLDAFRSRASNLEGFNSRRPVSDSVADSVEAPLYAEFSSDSSQQPSSFTTYNEDLAIAEDDWKLYSAEDPPEEDLDLDLNPDRRGYRISSPVRPVVQTPKPTIQPPARPQVQKAPPASQTGQREYNPYHRVYVSPPQNQKATKQGEMQSRQPEYNPNRRVYSNAPVLHSVPPQQPGYDNPYRRIYGSPQQHYQKLHKRSEVEQGSATLTILTIVLLACALAGFVFAGKAVYRCVQRRREKEWSWRCTGKWSRVEEEWVNKDQTQGGELYGAI